MKKTTKSDIPLTNKKTVDTITLQEMLGCGRKSALDIGMAARARVQIGKRVLWNVQKVQQYIDSISE